MKDLSLHVMDIAENSIKGGATRISVRIEDRKGEGKFILVIEDNGRGMDEETREKALSPFFSTKSTSRFGLGLPLLKQACEATGGRMTLESSPGKGTKVTAVFNSRHIDMKPLGDMDATLVALQMSNPEIELDFEYSGRG